MPHVPTITLNQGGAIPQLGLGVWQVEDKKATEVVGIALGEGYRLINTAAIYRNETGTGAAIAASGVERDELFVTTKLWNDDHGYDAALRAFDLSLSRLKLDYVDLYLIHWPQPKRDLYRDSWRALEKLQQEGRAGAIGVSNFTVRHLERLLEECGIVPAINQIELHPALPQNESVAFHQAHGIVTEAYSSLARGALDNPVIQSLARKHNRTEAQIVLRWHMQRGIVAIPKSANPARIASNIDVFGFSLDDGDMAAIATLETGLRLAPDPETF
jgi:2,5-diketo-D-gluconate reductase A